jgi:DNA-binding GntR family transcriptional regulator
MNPKICNIQALIETYYSQSILFNIINSSSYSLYINKILINMISSLESLPLYLSVANLIREKIFSHELAPGAWIDEKLLTASFGISRTPLREALKVLAAEGLITMKLRRGAYVTEVQETDIKNIFAVIALLEAQACRKVAEEATEEELEILDSIHTKLERAAANRDTERFFEVNQEFHHKLQDFAKNPWMHRVINDLRQVLKLQRRDSLTKIGRLEKSLLEHRQIMSALIGKKPAEAEALMKNHLLQGQEAAIE